MHKKENVVVGHVDKGRSGRFAKILSYFLRADGMSMCQVEVNGDAVKVGDGKGQKIPCILKVKGEDRYVNILIYYING